MKLIRWLSIFMVVILCVQSTAVAANVGGRSIVAAGAIVMDADTGDVLFSHNADRKLAPASMTKMMTVYLVYEAMEQGRFDLDSIVPISQNAADLSRNTAETNVPLSRTARYTVSQLLDVTIVMSAGGATNALAELVGGSLNNFYRMMNDKVEEWGINALFNSASGGSTSTHISPHAMAVITRRSVLDYPQILEKTAKRSVTFGGHTYPSTNLLLGEYAGINGFKTGTNSVAGACFTATAQRGDIRIISVIMGSTWSRRFSDTRVLLDYGFNVMENRRAEEEAKRLEEIEARKVPPTRSAIFIDGAEVEFQAYNIGGNNFFKIRDLAYALSGTGAQFDIEWDGQNSTILLKSGEAYTVVGGEMSRGDGEKRLPDQSNVIITLDSEPVQFEAYNIEDNNYFRLRDVMRALDVYVGFDEQTYDITIDTTKPYIE
jgi:D-alanyl-D-alanine carboxypeptidase